MKSITIIVLLFIFFKYFTIFKYYKYGIPLFREFTLVSYYSRIHDWIWKIVAYLHQFYPRDIYLFFCTHDRGRNN